MSSKYLINCVVKYLEQKGYQFLKCLGEGSFGAVIAVLTPTKEQLAVKIIRKEDIWKIEDEYWPDFQHPHILPVTNTMTIDELNVKLYFMNILPQVLAFTVHSQAFREDPNSLYRIKKWFRQILSAIEYLHSSELCHLDIKTDNVLIDHQDNAVLCDFSGLNITSFPVNRLCSPYFFRPKECFLPGDVKDIRGKSFDIWSFSLLALNVLTGHYPQIKLNQLKNIKPDWETEIWPVLENTLKESKFRRLMKKAFPNTCLSNIDIQEALHFLNFVMKIEPEHRPNALRIRKHPFLKIDSNPFLKELNEYFTKDSNETNPFRKNGNLLDMTRRINNKQQTITMESVKLQSPATSPDYLKGTKSPSHVKYSTVPEIEFYAIPSITSPGNFQKKKTLKKNVKQWFVKQFNRMFKKKQK